MKSNRLRYMPLTILHAKDMYELWSNPKVVKYMYCALKKLGMELANRIIGGFEKRLQKYDEYNYKGQLV